MKKFNALRQFFILSFAILLLSGCASNGTDAASGRPMCPMMDGKSCCEKMMEGKTCCCCQKMMENCMMKDGKPMDMKQCQQMMQGGMMKDQSVAPADIQPAPAASSEDHKKHHTQDNKEVK